MDRKRQSVDVDATSKPEARATLRLRSGPLDGQTLYSGRAGLGAGLKALRKSLCARGERWTGPAERPPECDLLEEPVMLRKRRELCLRSCGVEVSDSNVSRAQMKRLGFGRKDRWERWGATGSNWGLLGRTLFIAGEVGTVSLDAL